MILSTTAAYGIYPIEVNIDEITKSLSNAGFPKEDVCLLLTPKHRVAQAVRDAQVPPKVVNSDLPASELLRSLSRFGAVIIPGVAFLVSSRAFLRAVLAPCASSLSSAYADKLIGLGLPEQEADRYSDRLSRDAVMVFVCCGGAAQSQWIKEILRGTGAEEVSCLEETVAATCVEPSEDTPQMMTT